MADNTVKIILTAVDKASATLQKVNKSASGLDEIWKKAGIAAGVVTAGIVALDKALDQTVDVAVDYNKQIREMTQVTGLGAEEISRIVQVADDWGIEIGALRTSLGYMNKMGLTPSIDNLAKLADEYVNSADKSAFAEKAAKLLGRGYQTLIPLLAKGGQALRDQTMAVEDGLIATEDSIAAARAYEVALDEWNDSVLALKMSIGNALLPELTQMLEDINNLDEATAGGKHFGPASPEAIAKMREAAREAGYMAEGIREAYAATKEADMNVFIADLGDLEQAAADADAEIRSVKVALEELTTAKLAAVQIEAVTEAYQEGNIEATEYDSLMRQIGDKFTDLSDEEINQQILLTNLTRSYEAGNITLHDYLGTVEYLADAWGKVPKEVTTTYKIIYELASLPTDIPKPKQHGGPVIGKIPYLVGERGPELFIPGTGGTIVPNNQLSMGGGGGVSIGDIIINAGNADPNAIAAMVIQRIQAKMVAASRSGAYAVGR